MNVGLRICDFRKAKFKIAALSISELRFAKLRIAELMISELRTSDFAIANFGLQTLLGEAQRGSHLHQGALGGATVAMTMTMMETMTY